MVLVVCIASLRKVSYFETAQKLEERRMDGRMFDGIGALFAVLFPLAIVGIIAILIGGLIGIWWLVSHLAWVGSG